MRALFLLLVAVNLGLFAWQYGRQGLDTGAAATAVVPPPIPSGVKPLALLDKKPVAQGGRDAAARTAETGTQGADGAAAAPPSENAGGATADRVAPPAGERTADAEPDGGGSAVPASVGHDRAAPVCYLVGRFPGENQARAAVALFRGKRVNAEFSMREQQSAHYWVHTPVQASRADALHLIRDLNAKGLRDVAVVQTGDWKNSVSLGYYSNQASADTRVSQVTQLGLDAAADTQQESVMTYWVRYQVPGDSIGTADGVWQGLAAAHPKLTREGVSCR